MGNHYDTLEVRQNSSQEEIKQSYHRLAKEHHPDKNPSPQAAERMKQINEAYQVLSDPAQRARYDASFFSRQEDNIYDRWYSGHTEGFGAGRYEAAGPEGDTRSTYARAGYEAPRSRVVYESAHIFSFEHLLSSAVVGFAFGIAIATTFIFFGISPDAQYGLAALVIFAMIASFIPPFVNVLLLRKALNDRAEAGLCGSAALAWALPTSVVIGGLVRVSDTAAAVTCCMMPFVCVIAGWLIGGFIGKMAFDIMQG
jgi:hypothetical protein